MLIYVETPDCFADHAVREVKTLHITERTADEPGIFTLSTRRGCFDVCVVT